ncbi:uncharacterized protein EURHEDRAFT_378543 [Aspergillus ruber CBS 135680]|uniref:Uncharacterized protein n=1 Tax=Aspergillus ruber (strain CBS 135680) TaxID=1388766 RepID=A0A017SDG6_ASPRC|nr:uncharacterized protein EURHEDRAFT_378543 [Aspergillus ruber CBS 135680]EYE94280.1 hypothetical protein EURHEDRAFT_378543 [Aspergillus ruber CBS 135680]
MTYLIRYIICGASFPRHETGSISVSWLQEYRAVYYTSPSLSEVRLSGVGLRRSTDKTDYFTVPVGESERRDNEGHLPIDARVLKDEDGQYGFVFHDACWLLVKESKEERSLWTD